MLRKFVEEKQKRQYALQELRERQISVESKLNKKLKRLRKAFPTMNSERLSKFLNNYKKS